MKVISARLNEDELDIINGALREYINNRINETDPSIKEHLWDVAQLKGHLKALKRYK